jgi:hypothetical protein
VTDALTPCTTTVERCTVPRQTVGRPSPGLAVRETAQGTWYLPADGPGSLLRLPRGTDAGAVRRLSRLELPGLMPIVTVLEDGGRVWVATPVPSGPTVDDLLSSGLALGLGPGDAAAVLSAVGRTLRALHTRGLGHGALDPSEIVIAPDGAPLLVAVTGGPGHRESDLAAWARLAWTLAEAWCETDPAVAGDLRGCADLAEAIGLGAALGALPFASGGDGRRRVVRNWSVATARAAG